MGEFAELVGRAMARRWLRQTALDVKPRGKRSPKPSSAAKADPENGEEESPKSGEYGFESPTDELS